MTKKTDGAQMTKKSRGVRTPSTIKLIREIKERWERGEGPHPLSGWARGWNDSLECTHWWRHTVYGADAATCKGTWCELCGKRLR